MMQQEDGEYGVVNLSVGGQLIVKCDELRAMVVEKRVAGEPLAGDAKRAKVLPVDTQSAGADKGPMKDIQIQHTNVPRMLGNDGATVTQIEAQCSVKIELDQSSKDF